MQTTAQPVFLATLGRRRGFPSLRAADLYDMGYSAFKRGEQPPADVGPESSGWFDAENEYLDRQDAMRRRGSRKGAGVKAGTKVVVTFVRPEGDAKEAAVVCRVTQAMRPLPDGYVPVRFSDGGRVLVPASRIGAAS